jgi:hypothetical protein
MAESQPAGPPQHSRPPAPRHSPTQAGPLWTKPPLHATVTTKAWLGLVLLAASRALHVTVVLPSGNIALTPAL